MNRRAFLRTTVAAVVSAQYGQAAASFGIEPPKAFGPEELFAFLRAAWLDPRTQWHKPAGSTLSSDLRWSDAEIAAMGPARPLQLNVIRGELGRIDSGVRFIGFDLASKPDHTVHAVHGADGSWSMVVPRDPDELYRALRGEQR